MIEYTKTIAEFRANRKKMDELLKYHGSFRNLIAVLANEMCGVNVSDPNWQPTFIYKYEGGVRVNRKDVVLGHLGVREDYGRGKTPIREEQAVIDALDHVLSHVSKSDTVQHGLEQATDARVAQWAQRADLILEKIKERNNPFLGDPWRDFFRDSYSAVVRKKNEEAKAAGKDAAYF